MNKILLGTIIDTFTIQEINRIFLVTDAVFEQKVVEGDSVEVILIDKTRHVSKVSDAFIQDIQNKSEWSGF